MSKEEINQLKLDLIELGRRIKMADRLICSLEDPILRQQYNSQILILVHTYYELEQLLKTNVDEYVKFEQDKGNIIDFTTRKLKRQLEKKI